MHYKKKNGNRKRGKQHGFRRVKLGRHGDTWRLDTEVRKHFKAFMKVEEE